jgi:hypothetical protein
VATNKEGTLQINKFDGINITDFGTTVPPSKFLTMQNMAPVQPGELRSLGGVIALNTAAIPGLEEIVHADYWEHPNGATGYVAWYKPSAAALAMPAPTGQTFTAIGATVHTRRVRTVFVGPGGIETFTEASGVAYGAAGTTATLPTNVPDYVSCVHFFSEVNAAAGLSAPDIGFIWAGTLSRRAGTFPASIVLVDDISFVLPDNAQAFCTPTSFSYQTFSDASGKLIGGRRYYLGVAPCVGVTANGIAYNTVANATMAVDLPVDHNAIRINLGLPATTGTGTAGSYNQVALFLGHTERDLLPVCEFTDGRVRPVLKSSATTLTGFEIKELPYNSNLCSDDAQIEWDDSFSTWTYISEQPTGLAFGMTKLFRLGRTGGNAGADFQVGPSGTAGNYSSIIGAFIFSADLILNSNGWNATNRVDLLQNWTMKSYSLDSVSSTGPQAISSFYKDAGGIYTSQRFIRRLFVTNDYNVPWFTSGLTLKPLFKLTGKLDIPITKLISATRENLVLGGGPSNLFYTQGFIYASAAVQPWDFGTGAGNAIFVISNDASDFVGFGIYSENLQVSGPTAYLVIGKENSVAVWNGSISSPTVVQIDKAIGFASASCFVNTNFGPVFVGRDNIYMMQTANQIIPVGFDVDTLIKGMAPSQLAQVKAVWHEKTVKILYQDIDYGDSELWFELMTSNGQLRSPFSGPHKMKAALGQVVMPKFGAETQLRVSFDALNLYRRDALGTAINDGVFQPRKLVISRLGMGSDHFQKVMTKVYLALQIQADEVFTLTFDFEDGSSQSVITGTALLANGARQLRQFFMEDRIMGRIVKITIENNSIYTLSIFDVSLLFDTKRRRLLR